MPTPVFACGVECGIIGVLSTHLRSTQSSSASIVTSPVKTGKYALRLNPAAARAEQRLQFPMANEDIVMRVAVYFTSLPTADALLIDLSATSGAADAALGLIYHQSSGTIRTHIYTTGSSATAASGYSVTTGKWYQVDLRMRGGTAATWTVDAIVDETAITGVSLSAATPNAGVGLYVGDDRASSATDTYDAVFDDILVSQTYADYPLGSHHILGYVPVADGVHNVAGAADFEDSDLAADILNTTTTAYLLVDDVPLKATSPTQYIELLAPPNATDYVEVRIGSPSGVPTPTRPPVFVDCVALVAQAGTGPGNMELRLKDPSSATNQTIYTATGVAGVVAGKYVRAGFTLNGAGTAWTVEQARDLRVRFGSPAAVDANPDQYFASFMAEMAFSGSLPPTFDADYARHPHPKVADRIYGGKSRGDSL